MRVLDIGCGDGLPAVRLARRAKHIHGIDYIDRYVQRARANAEKAKVSNVSFSVGNVLDIAAIAADHGPFDAAVSIRCLINLPSWDSQLSALNEIAKTLDCGGVLYCAEGWSDGLEGLNRLRCRVGLEPISAVSQNVFIDRTNFERAANNLFKIEDYSELGTYLVISRVMHPLMAAPESPRHDAPINAIGSQLQANVRGFLDGTACDYCGMYILRRR